MSDSAIQCKAQGFLMHDLFSATHTFLMTQTQCVGVAEEVMYKKSIANPQRYSNMPCKK